MAYTIVNLYSQAIVNVDINHIERLSREIILESSEDEMVLIGNELITSWYLDNLSEVIDELLQEKGN